MTSPHVHLREITDDNREAVSALRVRKRQKRFVDSVASSLKEAARTPENNPWYRAVYLDDEPVGFVMLAWNAPTGRPRPRPRPGQYLLWRLLIDKNHQRCGVGQDVLRQIINLVRADGATELLTSYVPGPATRDPSTGGSASNRPV